MTLYIILIILLSAASAFFSGTESSYATLNTLRLRRHIEDNANIKNKRYIRGRKRALSIKEHFDYYLITILIGNNAVNLFISNILTILVISTLGSEYSFVSTIISVTLLLVCGEITPKLIGAKQGESWAVRSAVPLKIISYILYIIAYPLYAVTKSITKNSKKKILTQEELEAAVEKSESEGVIDEDKMELLQNAIRFDENCAYEVCTPRIDVKGIDIEDESDEWVNTAVSTEFSRLPVFEGSLDTPLGVLYVNDFLGWIIEHRNATHDKIKATLLSMLSEPIFVHHTMKVDDVYKFLNKKKSHLAFVSDEWGGTQGIITMDDALEELVGEIYDEDDEINEDFEMNEDGSFEVGGNTTLKDLFAELDLDIDEDEFESVTVGGLAIEILNKFPHKGDEFDCKNIHFVIKEVDKRRVTHLHGVLVDTKPLSE